MKFHLDEHISSAIAIGLRRRGLDVTTTSDVALRGAHDSQHIAFARAEGRVMVTHDEDFLVYHAQGVDHAGIAYCHQDKLSIGEILGCLILLHECYEPDEMRGRVEYL